MEAAAHGNGKLGIPAKVAKEFVAADTGKKKRRRGKPTIGKALAPAIAKGRGY